jgi:hypothetical protein
MPRYFFAMDDDLPLSEAAEELADDDIASNVATLIAGELSRNRYGRNQWPYPSSTKAVRSFTRFGPAPNMMSGACNNRCATAAKCSQERLGVVYGP